MNAPKSTLPFSAVAPGGLRPFCQVCGWRKGGLDSWNGYRCKCGHSAPPIEPVAALAKVQS